MGSMRVAVLQSAYVPWRGYFDIIASVDLFVIYDDVQYSKGTWRNRNQLKTSQGLRWLTVPVDASLGQAIDEVRIANPPKSWVDAHARQIAASLENAPHFDAALAIWQQATAAAPAMLSALNLSLIQLVCKQLGIDTPIVDSRDYALEGKATERLLLLLEKLGATRYLSGPAGEVYLDKEKFRQRGIGLDYKSYVYESYPQQFAGYEAAVSILDLIANCGKGATRLIRSTAADVVVLP
jgi:hypothetical protein